MIAFGNRGWMYYIQKLNNSQYLSKRKRLSVKYGIKCAKQPLGSLHYEFYVCEHLSTYGQYKVNREDVSHHYFIYLYFFTIFHCLINSFYCISFLIIGRRGIILLLVTCNKVESTTLQRIFICSCTVRSFMSMPHSSIRPGR
jgi:hypothetical protein